MSNCFNPANILLPNDGIDMEKWSVIACDQFTSQADYWDAKMTKKPAGKQNMLQ